MRTSRPLHEATSLFVAVACSVLFALPGVDARAQQPADPPAPTLDAQIQEQDQALTATEKQQVASYIDFYLSQLQTGTPTQISAARDRLLTPLRRPEVPEGFHAGYTEVFENLVTSRMTKMRDVARLNAMVLLPRLESTAALPLINAGLEDPNPGVRYWAAKGLAMIAQRDPKTDGLSQQEQLRALGLLTDAIRDEPSNTVLTQLLDAMSFLEIPQAFDALLDVLIRRVAYHVQNAGEPMLPEQTALRNLYQTLVRLELQGQNVNASAVQAARAAMLYMTVAARQAEEAERAGEPLSESQIVDRLAMIRMADQVLRWALPVILGPAAQGQMPASITNALTRREWSFILVQTDQWQQLLRDAGVPEPDLQMPETR